jgi:glutathione S-transferase
MLKLFYTPHTSALATHVVLEEVGAKYEITLIDFEKNEQRSPEYLKINPRGRVPSLVTDSGVLTETPAPLVYLAQLFPQSRLAPIDDPYLFAEVQSSTASFAQISMSLIPTGCGAIAGQMNRRRSRR